MRHVCTLALRALRSYIGTKSDFIEKALKIGKNASLLFEILTNLLMINIIGCHFYVSNMVCIFYGCLLS
jgi:hypothetical protein